MDRIKLTPFTMAYRCILIVLMASTSLAATAEMGALQASDTHLLPVQQSSNFTPTTSTQTSAPLTQLEPSALDNFMGNDVGGQANEAQQFYGYGLRQTTNNSFSGVLLLVFAAMISFLWIRTKSLNTK